jgi:hypothetical protein
MKTEKTKEHVGLHYLNTVVPGMPVNKKEKVAIVYITEGTEQEIYTTLSLEMLEQQLLTNGINIVIDKYYKRWYTTDMDDKGVPLTIGYYTLH